MSSRPALADHLLSLSAPRAAARLMPSVVAARATQEFAVPAAHVRLVDSAATATDFTAAMERLLLRRSTVGFDAEWRPDAHGVRSEPSLLQLAEETGEDLMDDEDDEDLDDPVPEITPKHFEMAMHDARRSVSDADLAQYSRFAKTMHQQRSAIGTGVSNFRFPEREGDAGGGKAAEEDDDLDGEDLYS